MNALPFHYHGFLLNHEYHEILLCLKFFVPYIIMHIHSISSNHSSHNDVVCTFSNLHLSYVTPTHLNLT